MTIMINSNGQNELDTHNKLYHILRNSYWSRDIMVKSEGTRDSVDMVVELQMIQVERLYCLEYDTRFNS